MTVGNLFRYPVKSMMGESLEHVRVSAAGLQGDRVLALRDRQTGSIVSAKHPQRWSTIRTLTATWSEEEVSITLANGDRLCAKSTDIEPDLSTMLGREIELVRTPSADEFMYRSRPDVANLAPAESREAAVPIDDGVTAGPLGLLAPRTFFDAAPVHLIFSSSLRRAAELSGTDAALSRFRPNIVIDDSDRESIGFAEDAIIGAELVVGGATLHVICPTPRCIVPTLPLHDRPPNLEVLRALAQHHRVDVGGLGRFACLGAYASVVREGTVRLNDPVTIEAHETTPTVREASE